MLYARKMPADALLNTPDLSRHALRPLVIVDDSDDDRFVLSRVLKSFMPPQKPIVIIESGQDLLGWLKALEMESYEAEQFECEVPDMIFLDLIMPGLDGIKTLEAIRKNALWSDVPVILATCSRNDAAIQEAEFMGANAFLPKPFSRRDVIEAVNRGSHFSSTAI